MNVSSLKEQLLDFLKERSVCRGTFTLASGAQSDLYIDAKQTTQDPRGAILVGRVGWELVKGVARDLSVRVDSIGGLTMGADPIAASIGIFAHLEDPSSELQTFVVRKKTKAHGRLKLIEGNFARGHSVVIVDDVITTGGSTLQAVDAIEGAFAASYYVEPTLTEDLDILVSFETASAQTKSEIIVLDPLFSYLKKKGYEEFRKEGIVIEGWPVQFIPVANDLDAEALASAREVHIDEMGGSVRTRVLSPEHIVAICLRVGRAKYFIRISQFLGENVPDLPLLCSILHRHGLAESWRTFCLRNNISDPCIPYPKA